MEVLLDPLYNHHHIYLFLGNLDWVVKNGPNDHLIAIGSGQRSTVAIKRCGLSWQQIFQRNQTRQCCFCS